MNSREEFEIIVKILKNCVKQRLKQLIRDIITPFLFVKNNASKFLRKQKNYKLPIDIIDDVCYNY